MKIVYIPGHLRRALEAAGLSELKKHTVENLVSILSPEDVGFYYFTNMNLRGALPGCIVDSFQSALMTATADPFENKNNDQRVKEVKKFIDEYTINNNAPKLPTDGMYLTSDLMDEDTLVFTHLPILEKADAVNPIIVERSLIDRVIQQLHGVLNFTEIVKLPVFAGYLSNTKTLLASG